MKSQITHYVLRPRALPLLFSLDAVHFVRDKLFDLTDGSRGLRACLVGLRPVGRPVDPQPIECSLDTREWSRSYATLTG